MSKRKEDEPANNPLIEKLKVIYAPERRPYDNIGKQIPDIDRAQTEDESKDPKYLILKRRLAQIAKENGEELVETVDESPIIAPQKRADQVNRVLSHIHNSQQ